MSLLKEDTMKKGLALVKAERQLQKMIDCYIQTKQAIDEAIANVKPGKTHIVKDGDTLRNIAREYYGSVDLWKALGSYNKLISSDITKGQTLEIPQKEVLQSGA